MDIYFNDIATYPNELITVVLNHFTNNPNFSIIQHKDLCTEGLFEAIGEYGYSLGSEAFFSSVQNILSKYQFIGYHVTRLANPDSVLRDGLTAFDRNIQWSRINEALTQNGIEVCRVEAAKLRFLSLEKRFKTLESTHKICLSAPRETANEYLFFANNFGGETAYCAFNNDEWVDVYNVLTGIGCPYIVTAKFEYTHASDKHKIDRIMIASILSCKLLGKEYVRGLDIHLEQAIPPSQIIGIDRITI